MAKKVTLKSGIARASDDARAVVDALNSLLSANIRISIGNSLVASEVFGDGPSAQMHLHIPQSAVPDLRPVVTTATLSASADYTIALSDAEQVHVVTLNGANVDITNLYLSGHAPGRKARLIVYFNGAGASVNNLTARGWIWPQYQGVSAPPSSGNGDYIVYDFQCTTSVDSGVIALAWYGTP